MLIQCPKCLTAYEIDETLIPENGKKLRCSNCAEIFTALKSDLQEIPNQEIVKEDVTVKPETENNVSESGGPADSEPQAENNPMDDIFQRLSVQTEDLFKAESKLPLWKKVLLKAKKILGFHSLIARKILGGAVAVVLVLSAYSYRFEIVRQIPFLSYIYGLFGIQSVVPGEGLEFENIVWNIFEEDYVRKLEVKGFIVNPTSKDIALPVIHVEMLDKDVQLLQALNQTPEINVLKAGERLAINIIVRKPSPLTKYVYVTFVHKDKS